ncbi:MAG: hypothetical protein H8D38_04630 [DPANN group archaeon]|nr:hypothetical protein [DPANN group archaeon]
MKNKGQWNRSLIYYSIFAIAFLVILTFFSKVHSGLTSSFRDKGCWASISTKTHTSFEYSVFAFENEMNVFCPSYEVIFGEEKGEILKAGEHYQDINYKRFYEGSDKKLTEEKVNEAVADEIVQCWQKFGHGELDAFYIPQGGWDEIKDALGGRTDHVGCRVCAEITFKLPEERIFTSLKNYLKETKLNTATGQTYYEYIAESERFCDEEYLLDGENCWEKFAKEKKIDTSLTFDTSQDYLVVFVRRETEKQKGTLNSYVMSLDTKNRVCKKPLPFR